MQSTIRIDGEILFMKRFRFRATTIPAGRKQHEAGRENLMTQWNSGGNGLTEAFRTPPHESKSDCINFWFIGS
ncbi:hypothetical protein Bsp3421_002953 [Burkholderia sp. FERM BP-3421]|jgi:hypothetical protein|uniref:hypothetical protein n=1 Tax=Burkholderia sp. FERM BP-3421 TaxID=1494466 RepID=UPI00235FB735|nr:hypothetical protein [Burkholderia sp. FERM BP-3421]WDD92916.1 hypothetical protein Bsp3421_002953 [Burkholderia sp. FERM BP-3421]